tara:strand:- start:259 stop:684 length:426 start_codon:yes stop_codon:yes gene_type:complete
LGKLKKNVSVETRDFQFQSKLFFGSLIANVFFGVISYFVLSNIKDGPPFLKLFGLLCFIFLIILFFFPSIIAFDLTRLYTEENIPTLKHPMRWYIFILNIILGVTGIGWLLLYLWACRPGRVTIEVVTYDEIEDNPEKIEK